LKVGDKFRTNGNLEGRGALYSSSKDSEMRPFSQELTIDFIPRHRRFFHCIIENETLFGDFYKYGESFTEQELSNFLIKKQMWKMVGE